MSRDDLGFAAQPDETSWSHQISGSEKRAARGLWIAAVVLPAIPIIGFGLLGFPFFMHPWLIPIPPISLMLVIGLVCALRALWETIRLKRFGDPVLDLVQVPVPIGGTVEGRINLNCGITSAPPFQLKLQCINRVLQHSGKDSHYVEKVLWTKESSVSLLPGGLVPVSIAMPPDQVQSSGEGTFDEILWRLTVQAPFRGVGFLEKYKIPVMGFTTAAQKIEEERLNLPEPSLPPSASKMFLTTLPFGVVGVGIMVFGFYLLSFGLADFQKAKASATWPTTQGTVERSIQPSHNAVFVTPPASNFSYAYNVNGTSYHANTLYPHLFWAAKGLSNLLSGYSTGKAVTVSYSPTDPANSCLLPGLRGPACQRLLAAMLVIVFGFLFGSTCIFAPIYGQMQGNTITYRSGSPASKTMGWTLLLALALGIALWWVS